MIEQDTIISINERVLLINKEGTALPISDSIAPITNRRGLITGAVLVFRDDSQRRLREKHTLAVQRAQILELQKQELQRLNQLKDDF